MTEHSPARSLASPRPFKSWLNVAVKLGGAGLSLLLLVSLARNMTTVAFADFSVILAWLTIATTLATFSMPLVTALNVAEYLAHDRFANAKGAVLYALGLSTLFSGIIILTGAVAVVLKWIELPEDIDASLIWLVLLLPISAILVVVAGMLQGLKRVITAEIYINVSRPILIMLTIALIWYLDKTPLNTSMVVTIYTLVSGLILLFAIRVGYISMPLAMRSSRPIFSSRVWFLSASGMMAVALAAAFNERIDIIVMSWLANSDEIAAYVVASRFFQTVLAAIVAVLAVMAPYLAERRNELRNGETLEINRMIQQTATMVLLITVLALAGFAIAGPFILMLFGEHFGHAYVPMLILASGLVIAALLGPAISISVFIGETRIAFIALLFGVIINAGLSYWFTPIYGAKGAATASAVGMLFSVLIAYLWLLRKSGLNSSPVSHLWTKIYSRSRSDS